jgi:hypothetical protein
VQDGPTKDPYRRLLTIKIGNETFRLYRGQSLHPYIFAKVDPADRKLVYVNVRGGYKALPKNQQARTEHVFTQVLLAIGLSKHRADPNAAMQFANEMRNSLLGAKI